jgi:hypothetical protein
MEGRSICRVVDTHFRTESADPHTRQDSEMADVAARVADEQSQEFASVEVATHA